MAERKDWCDGYHCHSPPRCPRQGQRIEEERWTYSWHCCCWQIHSRCGCFGRKMAPLPSSYPLSTSAASFAFSVDGIIMVNDPHHFRKDYHYFWPYLFLQGIGGRRRRQLQSLWVVSVCVILIRIWQVRQDFCGFCSSATKTQPHNTLTVMFWICMSTLFWCLCCFLIFKFGWVVSFHFIFGVL